MTVTAPAPTAGPLEDGEELPPLAPAIAAPRAVQALRMTVRQIELVFRARRELGETFRFYGTFHDEPVTITSDPDHIKSLFTASPEDAPSITGESPLRPIVGPNSTLTALGARHMRQRKLLLPPFHGEAVERYTEMIAGIAEKEVDGWKVGETIALGPRMQAMTLDVIMAGIFGVEGRPERGTSEYGLRRCVRALADLSTHPLAQIGELMNAGREEPVGFLKAALAVLDRYVYRVIAERRAAADSERADVLSLLLHATTEDGQPLTDTELRDELLTLVLAGHETTANQLAWTFERLVRAPEALEALTAAVRGGDGAEQVEATIHESMRSRPVIPMIGRRVTRPWRLGEHGVPEGGIVLMSILLLHHREDIYPDPFAFRPERFLGTKPGTYTWIPFGGGIRRCLGAALAMAEQRIVVETIARRCDLAAASPEPERAKHRNVTMIPAGGARVRVLARASR